MRLSRRPKDEGRSKPLLQTRGSTPASPPISLVPNFCAFAIRPSTWHPCAATQAAWFDFPSACPSTFVYRPSTSLPLSAHSPQTTNSNLPFDGTCPPWQAVPPLWGYDCVIVYRAPSQGLGSHLPPLRGASHLLRLSTLTALAPLASGAAPYGATFGSLPRRFPAAWFDLRPSTSLPLSAHSLPNFQLQFDATSSRKPWRPFRAVRCALSLPRPFPGAWFPSSAPSALQSPSPISYIPSSAPLGRIPHRGAPYDASRDSIVIRTFFPFEWISLQLPLSVTSLN